MDETISVGTIFECTTSTIIFQTGDTIIIKNVNREHGTAWYEIDIPNDPEFVMKRSASYFSTYFKNVRTMSDKEYFAYKMSGRLQ